MAQSRFSPALQRIQAVIELRLQFARNEAIAKAALRYLEPVNPRTNPDQKRLAFELEQAATKLQAWYRRRSAESAKASWSEIQHLQTDSERAMHFETLCASWIDDQIVQQEEIIGELYLSASRLTLGARAAGELVLTAIQTMWENTGPDRNAAWITWATTGTEDSEASPPWLDRCFNATAGINLGPPYATFANRFSADQSGKIQDQDGPMPHSADFTLIKFDGVEYSLTTMQANLIQALYGAWENRIPGLSGEQLRAAVGSDNKTVFKNAFRNQQVLWEKLIGTTEAGRKYCLKLPTTGMLR